MLYFDGMLRSNNVWFSVLYISYFLSYFKKMADDLESEKNIHFLSPYEIDYKSFTVVEYKILYKLRLWMTC